MSKVKIQGNASGTGVVTLTAPNTNTDRTITLPDGDISLGVGIDDNATSTAITIDASENVTVGTGNLVIGTSGKGIDFSAATPDGSGTTGSEVLDDYEEGTWTPTIYGTGTAGNHTYAQQNGQYTKIGDEVHLQGYVQLSALGTLSGNVKLSGFPFTIKNVAGGYPAINIGFAQGLSITASMNLGGYGNLNATTCNIHLWDATTGTTDLTEGELSGDGGFIFTITYKVA